MTTKWNSQRLLTGAAIVCATSLLTGCGTGSSEGSQGAGEITLWTHNAGNEAELASLNRIVDGFNGSQDQYTVKIQAFPQTSYNDAVTAAASARKLPCILDVDGPNVPNWAWAGYLSPLDDLEATVEGNLPSTLGRYNDQLYSAGYYDVALTMYARKSVLEAHGIRIATQDQPWDAAEFDDALAKLKASGEFEYPLDLHTQDVGEWYPYAFSPLLQSFGGDLIDRTSNTTAQGALNGPEAVAWATWFQSLVQRGYMPQKSGASPDDDFLNGKTALNWSGSWLAASATEQLADDLVVMPPPDFGKGPKVGGGSWQWAVSSGCEEQDGALAYMKYAFDTPWVVDMAKSTANIPASEEAAAQVEGYQEGGPLRFFLQQSQKFAVIRPPTPAYPFIATEFTKASSDILSGADPQQALDTAVENIDNNIAQNGDFSS